MFTVFLDAPAIIYLVGHFSIFYFRLSDHRGPILSCSFSANGEVAVTGGVDGKVVIWNVKTMWLYSLLHRFENMSFNLEIKFFSEAATGAVL